MLEIFREKDANKMENFHVLAFFASLLPLFKDKDSEEYQRSHHFIMRHIKFAIL